MKINQSKNKQSKKTKKSLYFLLQIFLRYKMTLLLPIIVLIKKNPSLFFGKEHP